MQCALGTVADMCSSTHTHTLQICVFSQIRANTDVGPMLEFDQ